MHAIVCPRYGSPDVLSKAELADPRAGPGEIVVDVVAASVNSADVHLMRGDPWLARLAFGLARPKFAVLGADVAGRVREVGEGVTDFAVGDDVVADLSSHRMGAFAQRVAAPAKWFVKKPAALSFTDAAALPMAAMTARQAVVDVARVQAGARVLVVGAAGGIGTFAIQIARDAGAHVTAMCDPKKHDVARALGVDTVAAGALDDGRLDAAFDVVIDAAAYRSPFDYRRALTDGGVHVTVGGAFSSIVKAGLMGGAVGALTRRRYKGMLALANTEALSAVLALAADGRIRPVVERTFTLNETAQAMRHVEDRHARGKVVIAIA